MSLRYIHIDTLQQKGATYNTNSQYNTFNFSPSIPAFAPNDYSVTCTLPEPLYGVRKIYLKSFSTAILFPTVRQNSLSNFLNITLSGGTVNKIVLVDKIYTSISTLIADLNVAATALFPSAGYTFSLNTVTGCVQLYSSVNSSFTIGDSNLAYILGFRSSLNTNIANTVVAPYLYNLSLDDCLYLWIQNVQSSANPNTNGIVCSFRIPITAGSYNINYSSQNISYEQSIVNSTPLTPITSLNIVILDRWGYCISSAGAPMSCTLAFE